MKINRLSSEKISEIIQKHHMGIAKLQIARDVGCDNSTVHYHINKYEESVGDSDSMDIYSIVKMGVREECRHPSFKCSLCGKYVDNIRDSQREEISTLKAKIVELEKTLEKYMV